MVNTQEFGFQVRGAFADVVELIPQRVRVALYVGSVGVALSALVSQRVVAIWAPGFREQVDSTVSEILPWVLFLIGVLGTAYRPGRGESPGMLPPAEAHPVDVAQAQEMHARAVESLVRAGWMAPEALKMIQKNELVYPVEQEVPEPVVGHHTTATK